MPPTTPFVLTNTTITNAIRILPSRYDQPPVLEAFTGPDPDRLGAAYELDALTNPRHTNSRPCARQSGFLLPDNELLHSHIVNGAFAHGGAHGRFSSTDCGTWYSAETLPAAQVEVGHHKALEYADLDPVYLATVLPLSLTRHTAWAATYTASLHVVDTSHVNAAALLNPGDYRSSQRAAHQLRTAGSLGITYPSIRNPGATCHAIFHPTVVQAVHLTSHWHLVIEDLDQAPIWTAA